MQEISLSVFQAQITSWYYTLHDFLCFTENRKALLSKLETVCLLFLCTFYFIVWLLVESGLVNIFLEFSLINLYNKF